LVAAGQRRNHGDRDRHVRSSWSIRHKSNIRKLLAGSEGRIGGPKSPPAKNV
jgi:hypothetical protein